MVQKDQEFNAQTRQKQGRYDKRLILKIVSDIESGHPRKELQDQYGLGKRSIDRWMKDYGSIHYKDNIKRKSYSKLQKRTIVSAIEQGRMSIQEVQDAYGIKNSNLIRDWILQFKNENDQLCELNGQVMSKNLTKNIGSNELALEKALEEAELKIKALNTLIDLAEEQLNIDIRKKSGAKQSLKQNKTILK